MQQICIECNKLYTSDDLLFCPDCAAKPEPDPVWKLSEDEFYDIISKPKQQPDKLITNICLFCLGGGCVQCQPKNYL